MEDHPNVALFWAKPLNTLVPDLNSFSAADNGLLLTSVVVVELPCMPCNSMLGSTPKYIAARTSARVPMPPPTCLVPALALRRSSIFELRLPLRPGPRHDLARHERTIVEATARLDEINRRLDANVRFTAALERLHRARPESAAARREADRRFDAFIRGASARIAETLG